MGCAVRIVEAAPILQAGLCTISVPLVSSAHIKFSTVQILAGSHVEDSPDVGLPFYSHLQYSNVSLGLCSVCAVQPLLI